MRSIYFFFGIRMLFACTNKPSNKKETQEKPFQLKIAAYNVEYSKNATAAEIGEALKQYNFDVVCL